MLRQLSAIISLLLFFASAVSAQPKPAHNLQFNHLSTKWDEAMPLGNGMLGALIWEKDHKLRLSLDRADLWDERKALDMNRLTYKWVEAQVLKKDYDTVQKVGDAPYDNSPYPTKLPAAAIEFNLQAFGKVIANTLDIKSALNTVKFENGILFNCYISATDPIGYFGFENLPAAGMDAVLNAGKPDLIVHNYNSGKSRGINDNSHAGEGLVKLGYEKGLVKKTANSILYRQPTYNGHYYEVLIRWQKFPGNKIIGSWTITNDKPASLPALDPSTKEPTGWDEHIKWWNNFWSKSSIQIPDELLEKQYYLELYKLGCVSRSGAPAITLQAVWTADNGSLPPWKGDFHNDLNTQLSYWPAYTSNHLTEAATYTDWLWKMREKNKQYTKQFFGVEGMNVPGVVTLSGDPMGGWIQYSMSPTMGAWCAQHFYWQWKYSMDQQFLRGRAYPYIHDVALYLENITRLENGKRKLPLSSSPEYHDNSIDAWFTDWSNFDLSLSRFLLNAAIETAIAVGKEDEADHWQQVLSQLPLYEINETGLAIAPGQNVNASHRHLSQCMAIYPLALLDINLPADKEVIENSLKRIEQMGTSVWCGYSFSWMACLYARAYQADSAVHQLRIFAANFCSPNSFHLNGDQKGGQYSSFTYRPFTLEGNFAFAQGIQELLIQSRNGYVQVFPAVPENWKDVSFRDFRTEGGFLISAVKKNGMTERIEVKAEKAGVLRIKLQEGFEPADAKKKARRINGITEFDMKADEKVSLLLK